MYRVFTSAKKVMWRTAFTCLSDCKISRSSEQILMEFFRKCWKWAEEEATHSCGVTGDLHQQHGKNHSAAVDEGDSHNWLRVLYKRPSKQQWWREKPEKRNRTGPQESEVNLAAVNVASRQRTLHHEPTVASYLNPLKSPLLALDEHLWWKCM